MSLFQVANSEQCKVTDKDVNGFKSITHQNRKGFRDNQVLVSVSKNAIETRGNMYALLQDNGFSEQ